MEERSESITYKPKKVRDCKFYELVERDIIQISPCWKGLVIALCLLAMLAGLASGVAQGLLVNAFQGRCVLFGNLSFETKENLTEPIYAATTIQPANDTDSTDTDSTDTDTTGAVTEIISTVPSPTARRSFERELLDEIRGNSNVTESTDVTTVEVGTEASEHGTQDVWNTEPSKHGTQDVWNTEPAVYVYKRGHEPEEYTRYNSNVHWKKLRIDPYVSEWGTLQMCNYCEYSLIVSSMIASFWALMFAMCPRGGKSRHVFQEPWRIVLPSIIMFAIMTIWILAISIEVTVGYNSFCTHLDHTVGQYACYNKIDFYADNLDESKQYEFENVSDGTKPRSIKASIDVAQSAAWLGCLAWFSAFLVMLFRFIWVVDFDLLVIYMEPKATVQRTTPKNVARAKHIGEDTGSLGQFRTKVEDERILRQEKFIQNIMPTSPSDAMSYEDSSVIQTVRPEPTPCVLKPKRKRAKSADNLSLYSASYDSHETYKSKSSGPIASSSKEDDKEEAPDKEKQE